MHVEGLRDGQWFLVILQQQLRRLRGEQALWGERRRRQRPLADGLRRVQEGVREMMLGWRRLLGLGLELQGLLWRRRLRRFGGECRRSVAGT